MTPNQQATAKAMAQAILAQAEQINRLTDSVYNLNKRLEAVEGHPALSIPPLVQAMREYAIAPGVHPDDEFPGQV